MQISSIVAKDAAKYFGIYCQHSSYKFYHQDSTVVGFNCAYTNGLHHFLWGGIGQDGKIDLPDYEETASYCSLYYSLE